MVEIRPFLLFDTTAVLAGKVAQWQEWERFGQCVLPQAVYDELEFLTKRAVEPQQEAVAREFSRYLPGSQYQISDASALVASGLPATLSKRARLEQSIAECAYAFAKQQAGSLTLLVSNDRPLVQRLLGLGIPNLVGLSVAELSQWIREQRQPALVEAALARMSDPPRPAAPLKIKPKPHQAPPPTQTKRSAPHPLRILWNGILLVASLSLLGAAGLAAWRVTDPVASQPVWRLLRLPELPGLGPKTRQ